MRQKITIAQKRKSEMEVKKKSKSQELVESLKGKALFIMGPKNVLRVKCAFFVGHKYFDNVILLDRKSVV